MFQCEDDKSLSNFNYAWSLHEIFHLNQLKMFCKKNMKRAVQIPVRHVISVFVLFSVLLCYFSNKQLLNFIVKTRQWSSVYEIKKNRILTRKAKLYIESQSSKITWHRFSYPTSWLVLFWFYISNRNSYCIKHATHLPTNACNNRHNPIIKHLQYNCTITVLYLVAIKIRT